MGLGLLAHAGFALLDLFGGHAGVDARRAARLITHGPWQARFAVGVMSVGVVAPVALVLWSGPLATTAAALLALAGLWIYEDLWVKAGQSVPLS
jgi:formate-dependent nitrite reductase membrane component NrfD